MKKFLSSLFVLLIVVSLSSACMSTPPTDAGSSGITKQVQVTPSTDTNNGWAVGSYVSIDQTVYTLNITLKSETVSHTTTGAEGGSYSVNGIGSGYFSMWQDGKGIAKVQLNSIEPTPEFFGDAAPPLDVIIKTTDLKFIGLEPEDSTTLICRHDIETLSPVIEGQKLTTADMTDEFDNCRLDTPLILVPTPTGPAPTP